MKTNLMASILGAGFALAGLFAFFWSSIFFDLLGDYYGGFNSHFVKDAGIAFFSSGVMLLLSVKLVKWAFPLTLCGSMFITLHGAFHIQMLVMGMATNPADIATEIIVIVMPSVLTAVLLFCRFKEN